MGRRVASATVVALGERDHLERQRCAACTAAHLDGRAACASRDHVESRPAPLPPLSRITRSPRRAPRRTVSAIALTE